MTSPRLVFENDKLILYQHELGEWDNLNHLIICKVTKHACIIDPFDGRFWYDFCQNKGVKLTHIWLTHTHWDHVKGVDELLELSDNQLTLKCHILEQERGYASVKASWWTHGEFSQVAETFGALEFSIHCTPGHTPGHVTIIGNEILVTGDCLFLGSCGRTDLFGGDEEKQRQSVLYLKNIFQTLSPNSIVLPGHYYQIDDGSIPKNSILSDFLKINKAINSAHDVMLWQELPFLSFDDNMAEQARRQRAKES
ncbi:MAG: MBL fold metallo-hydrolase [Candidatus Thermoplasmatota archaeon]|nr:MBL fold metallo-hydrolase [Candidatus Thermoplasmatota archaeon]MEC7239412.1 MBL fold metallo-hydrolase [Candidatus Thermoplasmatota archaeon]